MRTILEVIKICPKPGSTIPLIRKTILNSFDSIPLATLRFEILWHQKRMTLQNLHLQSHSFPMSRNLETQICQWYGVKRIKSSSFFLHCPLIREGCGGSSSRLSRHTSRSSITSIISLG